MSLKKLPAPKAFNRPEGYTWDAPSTALDSGPSVRWPRKPTNQTRFQSMASSEKTFGARGFTSKRMAAALRSVGKKRRHGEREQPRRRHVRGVWRFTTCCASIRPKVTVKVMGVAASAASVIAMAGDEVLMGTGSIMMIHNAWGLVIGNRHDFADAASVFETFDGSMASITPPAPARTNEGDPCDAGRPISCVVTGHT